MDSRRKHLRPSELTGTIWSFRFKLSAGPAWILNDPWWSHQELPKAIFREDGTMEGTRTDTIFPYKYGTAPNSTPEDPMIDRVQVANFPPYLVWRAGSNFAFLVSFVYPTTPALVPSPPRFSDTKTGAG